MSVLKMRKQAFACLVGCFVLLVGQNLLAQDGADAADRAASEVDAPALPDFVVPLGDVAGAGAVEAEAEAEVEAFVPAPPDLLAPAESLPAAEGQADAEALLEIPILVLSPMGKAVPGASLRQVGGGAGEWKSDARGEALLSLPPGLWEVVVSAPGYEVWTEEVVADQQAVLAGVEVMLDFPMGDVVVTGTRTARIADEAPIRTEVISRADLERKQAANLADSLEQETGIRVEMGCQNCGFTQIRMNGLESHYTQILIDGRPVVSSLAGVYLVEQIPEQMIERIEILKGGGSAVYGGNAVGGVINVITRKPVQNFANFQARGGMIGVGTSDTAYETRLSATGGLLSDDRSMSMHVYAGKLDRDPWDANGDGFSELGQIRQIDGGAAASMAFTANTDLQTKVHFLREYRRGGDRFDVPEHDAAVAEAIHSDRLGFDARWQHDLSFGGNYSLGYGLAFTRRDSYYGSGGDVDPWALMPADFNDFGQDNGQRWQDFVEAMEQKEGALAAYGRTRNLIQVIDGVYNQHFTFHGEHILTGGADFTHDRLEDDFVGYSRKIEESFWNVAAFVQHNWIFSDDMEYLLGLRVDKHNLVDTPILSPRLSFRYTPWSWLTLRSTASTGFRAPQIFDEDLHVTIVGGDAQLIRNAEDLGVEKSYAFSQQIGGRFSLGSDWSLKTNVNGFLTYITDLFQTEDLGEVGQGERAFLRTNGGHVWVYGVELELGVAHGESLGVDLGVSFEGSKRDEADPDFGVFHMLRAPDAYGYVSLWLAPLERLGVETSLNVTGPMDVPHYTDDPVLVRSPWFFVWDASLSYTVNPADDFSLKASLAMKNILNAYQKDLGVGVDRDAGFVYGPRLPRTLFASLAARF